MMRPEEIAVEVLRRWWVIAIVALVAAGVAYIGTARQDKTYTASVRLMAIAEPADYYVDLYAKNRLASYKDLINNWEFVRGALDAANLDIDPGLAQSKLQLDHTTQSNLIHVTVVDTDPERAAGIANALAAAFVVRNEELNEQMIDRIMNVDDRFPNRVNLIQLETASPPGEPTGPRVRVNTVAGGILGGVVGLAIALFLLYRDDTLKSPADLERYLDTPLLATVPER